MLFDERRKYNGGGDDPYAVEERRPSFPPEEDSIDLAVERICGRGIPEDVRSLPSPFPAQSPHAKMFLLQVSVAYYIQMELGKMRSKLGDIELLVKNLDDRLGNDTSGGTDQLIHDMVRSLVDLSEKLASISEDQAKYEPLSADVFTRSLEANFNSFASQMKKISGGGGGNVWLPLGCLCAGLAVGVIVARFLLP